MQQPPKRIKWTLFAAVSLPLCLLTVAIQFFNYKAINEQSIEHIEAIVQQETAKITLDFDMLFRQAEQVAHLSATTLLNHPTMNIVDIFELLENNVQQKEIFGSCVAFEPFVFDSDLELFAPYVCDDESKSPPFRFLDIAEDAYDYRDHEWYKKPITLKKPIWTKPYFDEGAGNILMSTYSVPLINNKDEVWGVATIDIALDEIASKSTSKNQLKDSSLMIVECNEGMLVSHPDSSYIMHNTLVDLNSDYPGITNESSNILSGKSGHFKSTKHGGETVWIIYHPISTANWTLVAVVKNSSVLTPMWKIMNNNALLLLVALAIMFFVVYFATTVVMGPTVPILTAIGKLSSGDFTARIHLTKGSNELSSIADSLNTMASQIEDEITKTEKSLERETLLRREIDHRVKNMLAQIVTLCKQAKKSASEDSIEDLTHQINSLKLVHELLSKEGHSMLPLDELVRQCCDPFINSPTDRLVIDGDSIFLKTKAAMCLSLVFNELATNAKKYGAFLTNYGTVTVRCSSTENGLQIQWTEKHSGVMAEKKHSGFGMQLLHHMIPFELEGTTNIDMKKTGLEFTAIIPSDTLIEESQ
jgi:two-component sensor histidine kinase